MTRREDHFTHTVEEAAAFERRYGEYYDPDPDYDPPAADEWDEDELEAVEEALAEHDAYESEPDHDPTDDDACP